MRWIAVLLWTICGAATLVSSGVYETPHARQAWIQMDKDLKSATAKIMRKAMPSVMKEVYKQDLSTSCLTTLLHFSAAIRQSKLWAFQMLDACGRFPEGLLAGTFTSFGNYQECLRIQVNESKLKLKGQYCTLEIMPPLTERKPYASTHIASPELFNISAPDTVLHYMLSMGHNLHVMEIKVGICTPSLCTREDIHKLVQIIPEKLGVNWKFGVYHCETEESVEFTSPQLVVLCILGIVALAVIIGTVTDVFCSAEDIEKDGVKAVLLQVGRAFSVPYNVRKLSDYKCLEPELRFVYGILFVVLYWTAISNTFMYVNYDTTSNLLKALEITKEYFYEIVLNRVFALQAIFFISGLLTSYRWLKSPEQKLNIWKFLFKRYWKYTPTYALLLALTIITPTWGSGPSWKQHMSPVYDNCKSHWWHNLLYVNNYMDYGRMCLDHTWLFAVDAQLHVIAIFILIPLKQRPKIGLMVIFVLAVASLISVALTNVYYDLPPNEALAFLHPQDRGYVAEHSYMRVYSHLVHYCTGAFVANLMHQSPNLKISKKVSFAMWLVTVAGIFASVLSVHSWRSGALPSSLVSALYAAFSKVAGAIFLAWLAVSCMSGQANPVRSFLSWRPFAFLGKLFFIAYIMHVPIINMVQSFKKGHMFVTDLELFYVTLNHASATFIVSYILYIFCEAPFQSLTKIVSRRYRGRTLQDPNICPNNLEKKPPHPVTSKAWTKTDKSNC